MSVMDMDLPEPKTPRRTPGPAGWWEIPDEEAEARGEDLYFLTIEDSEDGVDPFDEGLTADDYWAEGWTFTPEGGVHRSNRVWDDDGLHRSLATRYRLRGMRLPRSLRRVLKNNADLVTVVRPLRMTPAKDELNRLHIYNRFKRVAPALPRSWTKWSFYPVALREMAVFSRAGQLLAFSVIEMGDAASYVVKTVWHPEHRERSLGTFVLLKAFVHAIASGCEYTYVGPTILADPNFNYKLRFPGCELYRVESNEWLSADSEDGMAALTEPFPLVRLEDDESRRLAI